MAHRAEKKKKKQAPTNNRMCVVRTLQSRLDKWARTYRGTGISPWDDVHLSGMPRGNPGIRCSNPDFTVMQSREPSCLPPSLQQVV